jgi:hypothetical protein
MIIMMILDFSFPIFSKQFLLIEYYILHSRLASHFMKNSPGKRETRGAQGSGDRNCARFIDNWTCIKKHHL